MTFDSMELLPQLRRALAEQDYKQPTPVQAKTIPSALVGRDILGCAQTGTGKTAAFALPSLDYLAQEPFRAEPNRPTVLVLAPTRELAIQIGESFEVYGKHISFRQALVYGGVSQGKQVAALRRGVHVLVATPGRLLDLMQQKHINLQDVDIFILDEADRMLDMGFLPSLKKIIAQLPGERQTMFFSATMPPRIRELASQMLFNPVSVNVSPKKPSVERIQQRILRVDRKNKVALLQDVLKRDSIERAIVFTRTKRGANVLTRKLDQAGISTAVIHGNKSQNARQRALEAFRNRQVRILVATDVAARGIDIDGVTHVINYDMPVEPESYVHRIGRTGRAGADGVAITFCTSEDHETLRAIERLIRKQLQIENPKLELRDSQSSESQPSRGQSNGPSGTKSGKRRRSGGGRNAVASGGSSRISRSSRTSAGQRRKSTRKSAPRARAR